MLTPLGLSEDTTLGGSLPDGVSGMSMLLKFDVAMKKLQGSIPDGVSSWRRLKELQLHHSLQGLGTQRPLARFIQARKPSSREGFL